MGERGRGMKEGRRFMVEEGGWRNAVKGSGGKMRSTK